MQLLTKEKNQVEKVILPNLQKKQRWPPAMRDLMSIPKFSQLLNSHARKPRWPKMINLDKSLPIQSESGTFIQEE